ncbi:MULTISPECIES: type I restriction enzyme HsdR N-terminal domain-containing protein [Acidiphilium]|nr:MULTISPECIES: type I restriction enzyme HsdR N-terminal domain-containing protein [Acidiphilium]
MSDDFRQKLKVFASRMVALAPRCTNEESTKLFLILPFLNFLGYDDRNPDEVCPEHGADFSEKYKNRVDFAILKGTSPVIAIECKTLGSPLKDDRGQLRSYFNAAPTVKMGVIADGLVYEFYADSDEPNMMDQTAFLAIDLREVAKGKIEDSVEEGLKSLQKSNFDPENIGAEAKRKLIFQNVIQQIAKLAEDPSEPFVRMLLQNAGLSHIRTKALTEFREITRSAFREFINLRILQRLDIPAKDKELEKSLSPTESPVSEITVKTDEASLPTASELEVFNYVKRRLAFLVKENNMFEEIENIEFRKYKGKFVVFHKRERAGRLFDLYESKTKKYSFDFGTGAGGETSTDNLLEIDSPLSAIFAKRVAENEPTSKKQNSVKIA